MGWIGVDLDGTLAQYDTWRGLDHIGEPVPAMLERVKRWISEGREVKIFTARVAVADAGERSQVMAKIISWCEEHIGQELEVTNVKDFAMDELWDDRAVQVEKNTGQPLGYSPRGLDG